MIIELVDERLSNIENIGCLIFSLRVNLLEKNVLNINKENTPMMIICSTFHTNKNCVLHSQYC